MAYQNLHLKKQGHVALLALARPRRSNRIDALMAHELQEACASIDQDATVRTVVLLGQGKNFCAGSVLEQRTNRDRCTDPNGLFEKHRVADAIASISKPTIAVLQGNTLGQGLELALACDLRLAERSTSMGLPQVNQGAIPWDGGTQRLTRLVGRTRSLELLLTGQIIESQKALEIGLVNEITNDGSGLSTALHLAKDIAQKAPIATQYVKEAIIQGAESTILQGLRLEADLNCLLHTTSDRRKGIASFSKRTTPKFTGE
jgi:enoyl-CoA hydratase/carnithine racemase